GGEDQRAEPVGPAEHVLLREHAAPRLAEQVDPVEAELLADSADLLDEELERPLDVLRPVRVAAAELVVDDDLPAVPRELLEWPEVRVRGTGAAVLAEERH